ncbi:hypothetical protein [Cohnella lupini]|uniref:Uncharacterized protein n=1 Tax=Cohnella lupini TaxID=1294267 RepID=A0A3D9IS78_9BACL|nr:hypothetical protein [Cohnella lupini]RED64630.1 hypothetical protein DFP95_10247 [Cohnella lupini]
MITSVLLHLPVLFANQAMTAKFMNRNTFAPLALSLSDGFPGGWTNE